MVGLRGGQRRRVGNVREDLENATADELDRANGDERDETGKQGVLNQVLPHSLSTIRFLISAFMYFFLSSDVLTSCEPATSSVAPVLRAEPEHYADGETPP